LRHHDGGVGQGGQFGEDGPLTGRRVLEDGVERRDGRDVERPDEVDDVSAVIASPDPVLMLDGDNARAPAQRLGGPDVVARFVLVNPMVDFDGIWGRRLLGRMQDDDLAIAGVGCEVAREGGDSAVAWWIGGNEGSAKNDEAPRAGSVGAVRGKWRRCRGGGAARQTRDPVVGSWLARPWASSGDGPIRR
jgi:hypothetical protein